MTRMTNGHGVMPEAAPVGASRTLAACAALAVVVAAFAIALYPFRDHGQRCGSPLTSAVHGKSVVTPFPPAFYPQSVYERLSAQRTTYCRRPARIRLAVAAGMVGALLVFTVRWRVLDPRLRAVRLPDH